MSKLIVFEGLDSAGKDTQIRLLSKHFKKIGRKHIVVSQPSHSPIGHLIRSILNKEWQCENCCLQSLYLADGINTINNDIKPALEKGFDVICNRYSLSALSYGSLACDYEWLKKVFSIFIEPDITFFLDVPVEECIKRLNKKQSLEIFESEKTLKDVDKFYRRTISEFAEKHKIININGNNPIDKVSSDIITSLNNIEDTSFDSDCL